MFIKITKTHHRALDPRTTKTFSIGDVHEFEEDLAQDFIKNGFAIEYKELKQEIENKAILELPEIKEEEVKKESEETSESLEEESEKKIEEVSKQKTAAKKTASKK